MDGFEDISVRAPEPRIGMKKNVTSSSLITPLRVSEIVRLLLLGQSVKKTAEVMGLSQSSIHYHLRKPGVMDILRAKNEQIWTKIDEDLANRTRTKMERIEDLSDRALDRISELIESDNEHVALRASATVLDRNPETSTHHKVDTTNKTLIIDANMLALAASAALEIEGVSG
jgi:predicted transcriptional regulator